MWKFSRSIIYTYRTLSRYTNRQINLYIYIYIYTLYIQSRQIMGRKTENVVYLANGLYKAKVK